MRLSTLLVVCGLSLGWSAVQGQEASAMTEDPVHDELRAVRDGMVSAFQKKDIEGMLAFLHNDVVVTYQNAEVSRGHDGVREFHMRMNEGDNPVVKNLKSAFEVDELSILYGEDTAVAFGGMQDDFELAGGMDFSLDSRWTATLVKENGRWLIAAIHASTNMFDNGVSNLLIQKNSLKVGAMALILGLAVGVILTKLFSKNRKLAT